MKSYTKISVIIPAYNAEDYIERAIGSILMQDFDSVEVIVVNDGSTDATGPVCDALALMDGRIRVIHQENEGVSVARNAGIAAATGEYIMFMDADDVLHPKALERMYRPDVDFVLGGFEKIRGSVVIESYRPSVNAEYKGLEAVSSFFDKVVGKTQCYLLNSPCFKLFRRSVIKDNRLGFVKGLSYAEDKIFVMTFLCHVEKVFTVRRIVYSYMLQSDSLSSDMTSDRHVSQVLMLIDSYEPVLKKLKDRYPTSKGVASLYHIDLIGRYVCRILNILASRESEYLTEENVRLLYNYMDRDDRLGLFSIRAGQIPNILLYKINRPGLTCKLYRMSSKRRKK